MSLIFEKFASATTLPTDETGNLESVLKKKFFGDENIVDLENAKFKDENDPNHIIAFF